MQQGLEALRELKVAAQATADIVEIPEGNEDEPLTLAGRLRKVPECFQQYVSTTTRQYIGHILGLVMSYWPHTRHLIRLGRAQGLTAVMINLISILKKPPL